MPGGADTMREIEREIMLRIIDTRWREHLAEMDYLHEGIHLRAMGQKDPLVEWQREGFEMFGTADGLHRRRLRQVRHARRGRRRGARSPASSRAQYVVGRRARCRARAACARPRRRAGRRRTTAMAAVSSRCPTRRSSTSRWCGRPRRRSAATSPASAAAARSTSSATAGDAARRLRNRVSGGLIVRDFSDDLAALRKRLTEAEGYLDLGRVAGARAPSSSRRWASPTSGTTATGPRRCRAPYGRADDRREAARGPGGAR